MYRVPFRTLTVPDTVTVTDTDIRLQYLNRQSLGRRERAMEGGRESEGGRERERGRDRREREGGREREVRERE